jgi:photosystem II stability/assembly factor-like uncharacterized protein/predicted acyltransferase (DUF342 family)
MSTWKKYGGTNKLEKFNNLSVSTIVTDQFTLRNIYVGDWDVCGGIRARDDVNFNRDLNVVGTITCGNINILGSLGVLDTRIVGNLTVDNSLFVGNDVYLDPSGNTLLHGEDGRFGFNTYTPDATVDISSDLVQSLYIQSSASTNKNVIAQNATHDAIVVNVEPSRANIDFYVDGSLNSGNEPDAQLLYEAGGNFTIDVSNSLKIRPRTIFSQDLNKTFQGDERMTVYADAATKPYFPEIYKNEPNFRTGTAAYFVAGDNSSNVFLRMATDSGTGLSIGGGYFANNRIMGTIALTDASDTQYQALNLISGNLTTNLKTSIAINKYTVSTTPEGTNRYAMDINGPIKVTHEELLKTLDASFEIIKTEFYGNTVGFAFGGTSSATSLYTQYFATTTDGGYTWSKRRLVDLAGNPNPNSLENTPHYFNAIFMQSATNIYVAGDSGYFFNSTNGGQTWATITYNNPNNYNIEATALYITTPSNRLIIGVNNATGIGNGRILNSTTFNNISTASFISTGLQRVKAIHGTGDDVVIVGSGGIVPYRTTTNTFGSTIVGTDASFNAVKVYNTSHVVAVGTNVIYYTHNLVFTGSPNFTANWSTVSFAGNLQSVQILDELRAIAVGDSGLIMYSIDGYATWTTVTNSMLDAMGNAILVSGLSYTNVNILTPNDFVLVGKTGDPRQSTVFNVYAPYWLNRPNNNVIEASGNIVVSGDLQINDAGQILTKTNEVFNILPTVAKEINLGNTAVGGNTNVKANLDVTLDITGHQRLFIIGDSSLNGNLMVLKDTSLNQRLFVQGDASLNSNLTVMLDTSLNKRLFVKGDASLNSNLTVMKDTSLNQRLFVQGDASLNSNLTVMKDTSLNQRLFVQGDASLNSNLTVMKDTSLNQRLFVQGDASLNSNLTVMKDTSLNQRLFVQGDASLNSNLTVIKDTSLNMRLFVQGDASLNSNLTVIKDTSLNQRLFVNGDASFNANVSANQKLFVIGDASFNSNITVMKDTSLNQRLFVQGDASFNSNLTVMKDTSLNMRLFVQGDASFNSNIAVLKDTSLNQRLFVNGDASFNSNISANQKLFVLGDASFNANIAVINDTSLNKRLFVGGDASFNSNIAVLKDTSLNQRLFVNGDASFNANVSANQKLLVLGDASFNSNLTVINDTSLNKRLFVGGDASFNSNVTVINDTSLNKRLFVNGDASFNANVSANQKLLVLGDASFNSNIAVINDSSLNKRLFVGGDASFNSNITVLNDTSLNKRLFVGGDASFNANVSANQKLFVLGDASFNANLAVINDTSLNKRLFVGGDASFNSNITVLKDTSLNQRLFVQLDASFNGNVTVIKDTSLNQRLFVNGDASFNSNISANRKLFVLQDASFNSNIAVLNDTSLNKKLFVGGDVSLNSKLAVLSDTSLNQKLSVAGQSRLTDLSAQTVDISTILRTNTIDSIPGGTLTIGGTNAGNVTIKTASGATNYLTLGDANSNVQINGNLFLPGSITTINTSVNNLEIKNKTILLNDEAVGAGVSALSGLMFRDYDTNNKGHFLMNGTTDGFVFKSSYSPNRVNLDVSGLTLTNGLTQGFVLLKPNAIMGVSADYTMTTGTVAITDIQQLDASLNRRVERNPSTTTATTQVVDTKILATGLYVNKAVDSYTANAQMDIAGNAFITKLGLGTSSVNTNYTLDVAGNVKVSTNVDVSNSLSVQANIYSYGTIIQW